MKTEVIYALKLEKNLSVFAQIKFAGINELIMIIKRQSNASNEDASNEAH